MAKHTSGDPNADDRFGRLDDGDMHVVENAKPDTSALLLLSNAAAPTAIWDPVVPFWRARTVSSVSTRWATGGRQAPLTATTSLLRAAGSPPRWTSSE